jgi:predicted lipoprotein with Yx(FWY)xxD motif
MKRIAPLAGTLLAVLGMAGAAFASSAHTSAATTVVTTHTTSLGTILETGSGMPLYLDQGDKPPHFACTGGCLSIWPVDKAVGTLKATGAAKQSDLGTVKGPGGVKMVTYKGHPLYTFTSDSKNTPTGEADDGFYVVSPAGTKIVKTAKSTTTTSSSSTGAGYY